jgi:hypothetical protein
MKLDPQSLFGLHVHSCAHWLRPRNPPLPPHVYLYTRHQWSGTHKYFFCNWIRGSNLPNQIITDPAESKSRSYLAIFVAVEKIRSQ